MGADKMRARLVDERFEFAHDPGLHAANIGDQRTAFQCRQHLPDKQRHLREWRAENDQVRVGNRGEQVGRGIIHGTEFFALGHGFFAANKTGNFTGQTMSPHRQPKGAAQQSDADDGDFLKLHAQKDNGSEGVRESLNQ